jgi:hypothetical protein
MLNFNKMWKKICGNPQFIIFSKNYVINCGISEKSLQNLSRLLATKNFTEFAQKNSVFYIWVSALKVCLKSILKKLR